MSSLPVLLLILPQLHYQVVRKYITSIFLGRTENNSWIDQMKIGQELGSAGMIFISFLMNILGPKLQQWNRLLVTCSYLEINMYMHKRKTHCWPNKECIASDKWFDDK